MLVRIALATTGCANATVPRLPAEIVRGRFFDLSEAGRDAAYRFLSPL
jgi:hypothetical protein